MDWQEFSENTGNTNTSINVTGLEAGTYYNFRVSAWNEYDAGVTAETGITLTLL